MMNTNTTKGIKNPVTLKNILGLIAVLALALVLCAPHVKTPGAKAAVPAPLPSMSTSTPYPMPVQ